MAVVSGIGLTNETQPVLALNFDMNDSTFDAESFIYAGGVTDPLGLMFIKTPIVLHGQELFVNTETKYLFGDNPLVPANPVGYRYVFYIFGGGTSRMLNPNWNNSELTINVSTDKIEEAFTSHGAATALTYIRQDSVPKWLCENTSNVTHPTTQFTISGEKRNYNLEGNHLCEYKNFKFANVFGITENMLGLNDTTKALFEKLPTYNANYPRAFYQKIVSMRYNTPWNANTEDSHTLVQERVGSTHNFYYYHNIGVAFNSPMYCARPGIVMFDKSVTNYGTDCIILIFVGVEQR